MKKFGVALLGIGLLFAPGLQAQNVVFEADFQASQVEDNTSVANVQAGTAVGSWDGLPDSVPMEFGMHIEEDEGTGNRALDLDRFDVSFGPTAADAVFTEPVGLEGTVVQFDFQGARTGNPPAKDVTITGRDENGNVSFEIVWHTANSAQDEVNFRRFAYVDPVDGMTFIPQGSGDETTGGGRGNPDPARFNGLTITCQADGYVIEHSPTSAADGSQAWTSDLLPYNGDATEIASINFFGNPGPPNGDAAGYWLDNLLVTGVAGGPSAFTFPLSGAQAGVESRYVGCGMATLNEDQTTLSLHVEHNVADPTAAHIHIGAPGVDGGVVFPLDHTQNPIVADWDLSETDVEDLLNGELYVNIHTAENSGGEIRGQIVESTCDVAVISSNVNPPFIDEGTTVILTAPDGSDHQWQMNGADIDGATNRTLVFDPVTEEDAGTYTAEYNDGTKVVLETLPFELEVSPEGSVPAASLLGLVALAGACGIGGARLIRRRR